MEAKVSQAKELTGEEKITLWAVILVSALIFFAAALSKTDNLLKAVVIIADLYLSGSLIQSLTRAEGWYGVVMLRSKKGFSSMEYVATHWGREAKAIADFGLSLAYGLPFAYYLYKREPKKLVVHAVLLAVFYAWLQSVPAATSWLNQYAIVIGLLAGFLGLGIFSLAYSTYGVLIAKTAQSAVAPVVPGITLPFWEGLIAIAIVAAVHELAHGVLSRVEKLPVISSGVLLFGFLPIGAFVEPDEKKFEKLAIEKKRRILVVGTTSNFVFFLAFLALFLTVSFVAQATVQGVGVNAIESNSTAAGLLVAGDVISSINGQAANYGLMSQAVADGTPVELRTTDGRKVTSVVCELVVTEVVKGSPADGKLFPGDVIDSIDGTPVTVLAQAKQLLAAKQPGENAVISVRKGGLRNISLDANRRLGIVLAQEPAFAYDNMPKQGLDWLYKLLFFLATVAGITAFLNFALAVVNILPIFSTDGYRIAYEELVHAFGKRREPIVRKAVIAASVIILAMLAVNLARWFKFF